MGSVKLWSLENRDIFIQQINGCLLFERGGSGH